MSFLTRKISSKILIALSVIIIALGGLFALGILKINWNTGEINVTKNEKPEEKGVECPTDGHYVSLDQTKNRPFAIMIENHPDARPQSGLAKAEIVYEGVTEGGITRFMAVYGCNQDVAEIGPIRSARGYFLEWVKELNAFYAHAGGSTEGLNLIKAYDILDLNDSQKYFWRDKKRLSPHNLYTSIDKLISYAKSKKYEIEADITKLKFKDDDKQAEPEGKEITVEFSGIVYEVKWIFEADKDAYRRVMAGGTHKDKSGETIYAKNVIVQFVESSQFKEGDKTLIDLKNIGFGDAWVFLDGRVIKGTWRKESQTARTKFYNSKGQEIEFNRGPIWIEVLEKGKEVKIK